MGLARSWHRILFHSSRIMHCASKRNASVWVHAETVKHKVLATYLVHRLGRAAGRPRDVDPGRPLDGLQEQGANFLPGGSRATGVGTCERSAGCLSLLAS